MNSTKSETNLTFQTIQSPEKIPQQDYKWRIEQTFATPENPLHTPEGIPLQRTLSVLRTTDEGPALLKMTSGFDFDDTPLSSQVEVYFKRLKGTILRTRSASQKPEHARYFFKYNPNYIQAINPPYDYYFGVIWQTLVSNFALELPGELTGILAQRILVGTPIDIHEIQTAFDDKSAFIANLNAANHLHTK